MRLLLLGGTADGRKLAAKLHQQGVHIVYSVAGLVRQPALDCDVISGGFSQFGGLSVYIKQQGITAILDVTHPYAQQMSSTAQTVAAELNIPYWRFHRPAWKATHHDTWFDYADNTDLIAQLKHFITDFPVHSKVIFFFSIGQIEPHLLSLLEQYIAYCDTKKITPKFLVRTAVPPKVALLTDMLWLKAIGPFALEDELNLLKNYAVDAVISKNSGGAATQAKLFAASKLNIPVFMQKRPALIQADRQFEDAETCLGFILNQANLSS